MNDFLYLAKVQVFLKLGAKNRLNLLKLGAKNGLNLLKLGAKNRLNLLKLGAKNELNLLKLWAKKSFCTSPILKLFPRFFFYNKIFWHDIINVLKS